MHKVILIFFSFFCVQVMAMTCDKSNLGVKAVYFPNNESEILDMWSKQSGNLISIKLQKPEENLSLKLEILKKGKVVYSDIFKFDIKHQVNFDFAKIVDSHGAEADSVLTIIGKNQTPFLEICRLETKLIHEEAIGVVKGKYEKK